MIWTPTRTLLAVLLVAAVTLVQLAAQAQRSAPLVQPRDARVAELVPLTVGGLRQGMPYSEAREVVLTAGWQADYIPWQTRYWLAADAPQGMDGGRQQEYVDGGWGELETCSGTGQGLCWFNFHDAGGKRLILITAGEGDDPSLSEWRILPPGSAR